MTMMVETMITVMMVVEVDSHGDGVEEGIGGEKGAVEGEEEVAQIQILQVAFEMLIMCWNSRFHFPGLYFVKYFLSTIKFWICRKMSSKISEML